MFLLRKGSRNAFDADRNSGQMPHNMLQLCDQDWDVQRLGERRTVTCSENVRLHLSRTPVEKVGAILLLMVQRLIDMRLLDGARLLDTWWLIAIDGTLQDRGRRTQSGEARYRYVVEAKVVGPEGTMFPVMTEFVEVYNPLRDKADCELTAFLRLSERLHACFPRRSICLLLDGLYPVEAVFDRCCLYGWRFIATLREGRQPTGWDEAVELLSLTPATVLHHTRNGEHGPVEQTFRWVSAIPFGNHSFDVLFCSDVSPTAATLWAWVTNFSLRPQTVESIANHGGRARQSIETTFNVEKNGGFGMEHAFCAHETAARNYHLLMQVAYVLEQLLVNGLLRRLTQACRKLSDIKLIELLSISLATVPIDSNLPTFGQLRFYSSSA